jgi:predicted metal-dependent hydrolase
VAVVAVPYSEYPVEVVRSTRRRKTVQAHVVDGRLRVLVPARLSDAEVDEHVRYFRQRFERRRSRTRHATDDDLQRRADQLSRRHELPRAASVRWVTNQHSRWGSCTPATGEIRLSHRLAPWPEFVVDAVLVHELAHLVEPNHSKAFRALEARFPLLERANGFLLAQAYGAPSLTDAPAPTICDLGSGEGPLEPIPADGGGPDPGGPETGAGRSGSSSLF